MAVDRAQTGPEDVRSPAATDLADKVTAVPRPTDDLFDWYIVADKRGNCIMGVLTPQVALISQPFRSGQEGWIDRRSADCSANPTHGPTYGVKERRARVSIRCQRSATWKGSPWSQPHRIRRRDHARRS